MNRLLQKLQTKGGIVFLVTFIGLAALALPMLDGSPITPEELGVLFGIVVSFIIWFGPIIFVDLKNLKLPNPKEKFVEPIQWKLGIFYVSGILITAFISLIILVVIQLSNNQFIINTEGLVGSMLTMFLLFSPLLAPITVYMLNAKLRYKEIVEYKSLEWNRLHKRGSKR